MKTEIFFYQLIIKLELEKMLLNMIQAFELNLVQYQHSALGVDALIHSYLAFSALTSDNKIFKGFSKLPQSQIT